MNRIKQLRKQKGITAQDLADKLGIAQSMLTNYENGGTMPRNAAFWNELAEFFGVSAGYLMGVTNTLDGIAPDAGDGIHLSFIVLDDDYIKEKVIRAKQPVELDIRTPEMYALLANVDQLPDGEVAELLEHVRKIIRKKYKGRLTEFRLPSNNKTEE